MYHLNAFQTYKPSPVSTAKKPFTNLPTPQPATNVSTLMHLMAPSLSGLQEDSRQAEIEIPFLFTFSLLYSLLSCTLLL